MVVHTRTQEVKYEVPAIGFFKAFVTDYNTLPEIIPTVIKSIEIIEGNGGVGTIRKTNFADGSYATHRIDYIGKKPYETKYTLIEGGVLGGDIESVIYDQKFEDLLGNTGRASDTPHSRSVITIVREWYTKGDDLNEDIVKAEEENYLTILKLVEEYLKSHPGI